MLADGLGSDVSPLPIVSPKLTAPSVDCGVATYTTSLASGLKLRLPEPTARKGLRTLRRRPSTCFCGGRRYRSGTISCTWAMRNLGTKSKVLDGLPRAYQTNLDVNKQHLKLYSRVLIEYRPLNTVVAT